MANIYQGKIAKPKSQSKKIRDIIFRIWEQGPKIMNEEMYYRERTDKIISELLVELQELTDPPVPAEEK